MIEIVALIVTFTSLAVALYQGSQRSKLKEFIRSEAWYLYSKTSNTNGQFQQALNLYKRNHKDNLDPEFIESISKGDGFGQDLTRETIRLIQLSEPTFNHDKIDEWISNNKIHEGHKKLFKVLVVNGDNQTTK